MRGISLCNILQRRRATGPRAHSCSAGKNQIWVAFQTNGTGVNEDRPCRSSALGHLDDDGLLLRDSLR